MTEQYQLENGIHILFEKRPKTERLICDVMIAQGSQSEDMSEKGLLYLTAKSLLGGTADLSRKDLAEKIESKGASYGVVVSRENVIISCETLATDMNDICTIVFDFLSQPAFAIADVDIERQQMTKALKLRTQKPQNKVRDALWRQLSGDAGYLPMGVIENIEKFTIADLQERHKILLSDPSQMTFSFVGDGNMDDIVKLVSDYFGSWQKLDQPLPEKGEHHFTHGYICEEQADNEQLVMAFGFPASSRYDQQSYVYHMAMEALCGGMSSPMFQEVREKRGLVYSIWGDYMPYGDKGALGVFTSTGRGQCRALLETAISVFAEAIKNGFSDQVIASARERILRSIEYRSENADYVCERQGLQMQYYGRVIPLSETAFYLSSVTSEHMQYALYQSLMAGKMAFANLGPQDEMPSQEDLQMMITDALKDTAVTTSIFDIKFDPISEEKSVDNTIVETAPERTVLDNGLTIISQYRPGTVAMGAWVGIGASYEEERVNGITHMMEHMMFRGTPNYKEGVIDHIIENKMGGNLNAYTSRDHTAYYFYSLRPEHMPEIVKICGDMVFHANLDNLAFDGVDKDSKGERDVVIEEIRQYADDVQSMMRDQLMETAYPSQPHGRPILGPETGIANMDIVDLVSYRDRYYLPNNVVFSAVGPVSHADIVAEISQQYAELQSGDIPTLSDVDYQGGVVTKTNHQAVNAVTGIYYQSCAYGDDMCHAFEILSEILTGGKSSAFYQKIVQDEKIAPYVATHQSEYKHVGGFYMATAMAAGDLERFFELFYEELVSMRQHLDISALNKAKAQLKMAELAKYEANIEVCMELAETSLMLGTHKTPAEYIAAMTKVSAKDVMQAIDVLMQQTPTISIIVPDEEQQKKCPSLDQVLKIRDRFQNQVRQKAG